MLGLLQCDLRGQGVYAAVAAAAYPAGVLQRRRFSAAIGRIPSCKARNVDLACRRSSMGYEMPSGGRANRSTSQE